jgi:AcrR family transcriptional regulator
MRKKSKITPRKKPQQERSSRLVDAILEAAVRVLTRDGAAGFNTIAVAERAGVSVGSLYQYFRNKESILFRLQEDEWRTTGKMLDAIFEDARLAPEARLRSAMRAFFKSECDEAPLRRALGNAASLYNASPTTEEQRERTMSTLTKLLGEVVPGLSARRRSFAAEMFLATMKSIGEHVSETAFADVDTWANATANMFFAYLKSLPRTHGRS